MKEDFIFKNDNSIVYFGNPIKLGRLLNVLENIEGVYTSRYFAFSNDNYNYSSYKTLLEIQSNTFNEPIYLKIVYIGNITIKDVKLEYENYIDLSIKICKCSNIENKQYKKDIDYHNNIGNIVKNCFKFNPYTLLQSQEMFNYINDTVTNTYGHCVRYLHFKPDEKANDYVFFENTFFNEVNAKEIKIITPGNKFPTNQTAFNMFDLYSGEEPFEIQITIQEWNKTFGNASRPSKNDVLFIPIMNRLYQVVSAYMNKEFILNGTYFKVYLIKYQQNSDRMLGKLEDELQSRILDKNLYAKQDELEIKKVVRKEQTTINHKKFNKISTYNKQLNLIEETPLYKGKKIYENSLSLKINDFNAITYKFKLQDDFNYCISFQLKNVNHISKRIIDINGDGVKAKLKTNYPHNFRTNDYVVIEYIIGLNGVYQVEVIDEIYFYIKTNYAINGYVEYGKVTLKNRIGLFFNNNEGIYLQQDKIDFFNQSLNYNFDYDRWYSISLSNNVFANESIIRILKNVNDEWILDNETTNIKIVKNNNEIYYTSNGSCYIAGMRIFDGYIPNNYLETAFFNIQPQSLNQKLLLIDNFTKVLKVPEYKTQQSK